MTDLIGSLHLSGKDARFAVYDHEARRVAGQRLAYGRTMPDELHTEYDAAEIWRTVEAVITGTLGASDVSAADLAAIGIANQRETTVVWNRRTGEPYYAAISSYDRRTAAAAESVRDDRGSLVNKKTGLVPDAMFSAGKIQWILDNVDGVRADAERGEALFGTLDSWLVWNLTGGVAGGLHVTDVTNASRTLLMSLDTEDWDDELLALFRVPRAMLPAIGPSSTLGPFGATSASGPLGAEVPIGGVLGEHQAALIGQHGFGAGEARYCCEASSVLLVNTGTTRADAGENVLTTVAYRFGAEPTRYALEGIVPFTGATVQWLVDGLGIIRGVGEVEAMARRADDPEGMYFVPAFTGLTVPHRDLGARGAIVGLDPHHNQNHVARATLQALAYQARDLLETIRERSGVAPRLLRVDGNGAWFDMCMQIHADILGINLSRPTDVIDTAALGACYAACLAAVIWRDTDQVASTRRESHRWSPQWMEEQRQKGYAGWLSALQKTYGWADETTMSRGDRFAATAGAEWQADGSR
jgi:glycerol kinase